jgi:hypothetical protein
MIDVGRAASRRHQMDVRAMASGARRVRLGAPTIPIRGRSIFVFHWAVIAIEQEARARLARDLI